MSLLLPAEPNALPLLKTRDGAVVTLRFNRPKALNSLDVPMAQALLDALHELRVDASVRAIILVGEGKGFIAGGDLPTMRANPLEGSAALLKILNEAVCVLAQINAPVIAQVHGVAAGAGVSLMLQADYVIAADDTRFNLAYINLGTSCDVGASWALPRLVGMRQALEIALLGQAMDASEAQRLGLVNRIVPVEQLGSEAHALAIQLANGPTLAYGAMKRLMRASFDRNLKEQLDAEAEAFLACAGTQDFRAGVEAFFSKQTPQFNGK